MLVNDLKDRLNTIKKEVQQSNSTVIRKPSTQQAMAEISKSWFRKILPLLQKSGSCIKNTDVYSGYFTRLHKYSEKPNRSSSILKLISDILSNFYDDITVPLLVRCPTQDSELSQILELINDPDENEYLQEAIKCVEAGFLRAAIILGWSAAMYRIHKVIEKMGFDKFTSITVFMKNQQSGRFKRFNKNYIVTNMSDMQEVFDSDTLLALEALGLIDNNENTRLLSCYNLRCTCGHPGNAPITKYNAMSFFSDIITIVFNNARFSLT